ncbi:LysR family transcriptional regulator [Roseibacterium sp. SDUM158017]|uniref:LysR family transcriptional regulator n=1 Tax=Roseicyclus salinarum TaxID=3036773 RepID=UPI0024152C68|nr:LysR family transcriptional regulator [Roseibacterium sp. SDUM158017]MDG4648620.1 LysR family transcriptional regulator [Roseibacterium sp. SDUM158017]
MKNLDWNLLRAFHATVAEGSLSAAALRIGLTQPTLSRQVAALEADLGVALFDRVGRQLVLTGVGRKLFEMTETMADTAAALALTAKGQEAEIGGHVSVSATDSFSQHVLPEIVERVRATLPQVTVSVVVANALSDLHRGEADIAIRHAPPVREGLVGHHVRDSEVFFYASADWVARNGRPETFSDLEPSALIGFDDLDLYARYLRGLGIEVAAGDFRLASESSVVIWEMVTRGMGVAPMHREIADRTPGVVRLFPDAPPIRAPIWIVIHERLQTSPRIMLVRDILHDMLAAMGGPSPVSGGARR